MKLIVPSRKKLFLTYITDKLFLLDTDFWGNRVSVFIIHFIVSWNYSQQLRKKLEYLSKMWHQNWALLVITIHFLQSYSLIILYAFTTANFLKIISWLFKFLFKIWICLTAKIFNHNHKMLNEGKKHFLNANLKQISKYFGIINQISHNFMIIHLWLKKDFFPLKFRMQNRCPSCIFWEESENNTQMKVK